MAEQATPTSSSAADTKRFISANELNLMAEKLAYQVAESGYRPTFLIALWRGGCQPGAVVQEFLELVQGTKIDHVAVRTVSRDSKTGEPLPEIQVHGLGHLVASLKPEDTLLIEDDVWDSGRSAHAIVDSLKKVLGVNMPRQVKVATVFYKPKRNKYPYGPDFYEEATDDWLVFPHELVELTDAEVQQFRPHAWALAQKLKEQK